MGGRVAMMALEPDSFGMHPSILITTSLQRVRPANSSIVTIAAIVPYFPWHRSATKSTERVKSAERVRPDQQTHRAGQVR